MNTQVISLREPRALAGLAPKLPALFLPDEKTAERHRAKQAGIKIKIGNHSLRATGITDHLKSDGSLAEARRLANHADTRITQLYDRRSDTASLREYEKVGI